MGWDAVGWDALGWGRVRQGERGVLVRVVLGCEWCSGGLVTLLPVLLLQLFVLVGWEGTEWDAKGEVGSG